MAVDRLLPTDEGAELVAVVREIAQAELAPRAAADEAAERFPRDTFAMLGEAGLLGLPYPEEYGGAGQPYEVYLQALEEVAAAWMTVGVGVSVHVMASYALAAFGTPEQRATFLPEMIGGKMLGAYALSEAQAGSDISGMTTRAKRADHDYELNGAKAWTTHGSYADFYTTFARTGDDPREGVSCFYVPGHAHGLTFGSPEHKMGLNASPTTALYFDAVTVGDGQRIGDEGQGARIALSSLDSGRLGIAACATGLAQAALDLAADYVTKREQFGRPIAEFQGLRFLLADMAAAVDSARATYLVDRSAAMPRSPS
jgi:alkylation response protein AidB-like acyl-CoA dehydrogenase